MLTFRSPKPSVVATTVLLILGCLCPTSSRAQACGEPEPQDRSDSRLPAGYKAARWGMSGTAVQALRGHALERYPDPMHPDVFQLHETILEQGSPTVTVRYTFYKDRLMEVTQYLRPYFLDLAESSLLMPYNQEYGPFTHKETRRGTRGAGERINREILENRWTWCDRFTEVVLARQLEQTEVILRRSSRLLFEEMRQTTDELRDLEAWKRLQELPTD